MAATSDTSSGVASSTAATGANAIRPVFNAAATFPLPALAAGISTPESIAQLFGKDPDMITQGAALWRSPSFSVSLLTPDLSRLLGLTTGMTPAPGSSLRNDGGASSGGGPSSGGSGPLREKNPFAASFSKTQQSAPAAAAPSNGGQKWPKRARMQQAQTATAASGSTSRTKAGTTATGGVPESPRTRSRAQAEQQALAAAAVAAASADPFAAQQPNRRRVTTTSAPPVVSPIRPTDDPETKRRKKRERNRLAAARCRQRKLDLEFELRNKLEALRAHHQSLFEAYQQEHAQLIALKAFMLDHAKEGCKSLKVSALS